ncbi:hypothetical protein [Streptacidiphilus jiangxiensis]|uniref:Uncharacterized protein n=1 Tax=Streptacidiphilus jiangxiensis TaxID=235985 RepID=A0A1H8B9S5_STRJI|nr:hypothetical protein [Streptacidiphilus jiangxiensis]SEM79553.1 hypothetical protein SAMN05414137_1602 [Streptacidiphilus jiangxiensis]
MDNGFDYPQRVRITFPDQTHLARLGTSVYLDRTVATPCLGFLRPGTYALVADDKPVTCSFCRT